MSLKTLQTPKFLFMSRPRTTNTTTATTDSTKEQDYQGQSKENQKTLKDQKEKPQKKNKKSKDKNGKSKDQSDQNKTEHKGLHREREVGRGRSGLSTHGDREVMSHDEGPNPNKKDVMEEGDGTKK